MAGAAARSSALSRAEARPEEVGPRSAGPEATGPAPDKPDYRREEAEGYESGGFPWRPAAVLAVLAVLLLALDLFWYAGYRADSQLVSRQFPVSGGAARSVSDDAAAQLLAATKQAAARYLSYDYRHIQQDKAAAASVMTGDFRSQYVESMDMTIIPVALRVKAVVAGQTMAAGVSSLNADATQGVVIAFVNETVTNTKIKGPRVDMVRLRLTMDKVGGGWLISRVESV